MRNFNLNDFDYELPKELIANYPVEPRDSSKMLVLNYNEKIIDDNFFNIANYLKKGDVLVFNDSKVIPARLFAKLEHVSGAKIDRTFEILLNKRIPDNKWECFISPLKKLKIGDILIFSEDLSAKYVEKTEEGLAILEFNLDNLSNFFKIIKLIGHVPLPPYIKREDEKEDIERYQTIYAKNEGSVAAPTAGLHFTDSVFSRLDEMGVEREFVTLHVGAGTFLPVKSDDISQHKMHSEFAEISEEVANRLNKAKKEGRRVICVGTTSLRVIESAANEKNIIQKFCQETDIFIKPGYDFKFVDVLVTNFHLPKSTLLMLVSAFAGYEKVKQAYLHAVQNKYRFFSYGDACMLFKGE